MKFHIKKGAVAALAAAGLFLTLGAGSCDNDATKAYDDRIKAEKAVSVVKEGQITLEQKNLQEKQRRDERPNQIGYVYLLNFGKPFGYYVIKGKISSSGSQLAPENAVVQPCSGCDRLVTDGPQDDNTYGEGDPGIFFFTPEGNMIVTSLDYFYSEQPVAFGEDVINLGKK